MVEVHWEVGQTITTTNGQRVAKVIRLTKTQVIAQEYDNGVIRIYRDNGGQMKHWAQWVPCPQAVFDAAVEKVVTDKEEVRKRNEEKRERIRQEIQATLDKLTFYEIPICAKTTAFRVTMQGSGIEVAGLVTLEDKVDFDNIPVTIARISLHWFDTKYGSQSINSYYNVTEAGDSWKHRVADSVGTWIH